MIITVFHIFNVLAERYDKWYDKNRLTALNELRLVKTMMPQTRGACLEIGGGTGFFASKLGCINVDPAERVLAISRRRGTEAIQGVGEFLPIRHGSVSVVLIIVTLCFVDEPMELLRESRRVLKDEGVLITCIVPRNSPWGIHYIARRNTSPFYRYARFYTLPEIEGMLINAGFRIVDEKGILSYKPWESPRYESPSTPTRRHGFVCIKAVKR